MEPRVAPDLPLGVKLPENIGQLQQRDASLAGFLQEARGSSGVRSDKSNTGGYGLEQWSRAVVQWCQTDPVNPNPNQVFHSNQARTHLNWIRCVLAWLE